jgi:hypothetical protein
VLDDRQSKPSSACVLASRFFDSVESFKNAIQVFGRDPYAAIGDFDQDLAWLRLS